MAKTKWTKIEPQGKPIHDCYYGYPDKTGLENTLKEVLSHVGERVILTGGGGPGSSMAKLQGAHIEPFPMRINGDEVIRWGLKVDLRMQRHIFGSKDFDPWLDSWGIWVKAK